MSDILNMTAGNNKYAKRVCRVAYTLNNEQPVACTLIGEQPLFYMDFDASSFEDDDIALDGADIGILEKEIKSLKDEIEAYDKFSYDVSRSTEQRVAEFFDDSEIITSGCKKSKKKVKSVKIEELLEILSHSRLASAYLEAAKKHNVEIRFSNQVEKSSYDRKAGVIFLNPVVNLTELVLLSVRELRIHWQHRQGALIYPLVFQADSAILVNRLQAADLSVAMVRVAWELQLSGYKDAWENIESSQMGDLARAFAREAFLDFRTINNGVASAAVLEAWFLSERCRHHDRAVIQDMLADDQGYVFDIDHIVSSITPDFISALGEMPFGKNYLAEHALTIMQDPIFTDVRDRSNSNFLWFIKFERSFKETEQELQTSGESTDGDIHHDLHSSNQGFANAKQKDADIVQLFDHRSEKCDGRKTKILSSKSRSNSGGNIVYLRRAPSDASK